GLFADGAGKTSLITFPRGGGTIAWGSSDRDIVTIDDDGLAAARGVGTAGITARATVNGLTAATATKVTVTGDDPRRQAASVPEGVKKYYDKAKSLYDNLRQQLRQLDDFQKHIEKLTRPPRDVLQDIANHAPKEAVLEAEIAKNAKNAVGTL